MSLVPIDSQSSISSNGWIDCRLTDTCISMDYGLTASATDDSSGVKFLRITDIVSGHVNWDTVPYVTVSEEVYRKYQLRDGDIVIARTGASTGASAFIQSPPKAVFASYLVRLNIKPEFEPRFLAYCLKSEDFWSFMRGVLGDKSAQPNASASTMGKAPLNIPELKTDQRRISHILGTLDDKIELNRRMNATLDGLPRALFKSWFVDSDPVRAKMEGRWRRGESLPGMPADMYDLFPERLVPSELGEVPEGWEVKALDEIANFRNGLALQKFRPNDDEDALPVVKIAQLRSGKANGGEWATENITPECIIDNGDVIFSWSGSLMVKVWCGGRAALNQHLFKVTSAKYPKWFYLSCVQYHLEEFQGIAADKATTMGHIKRQHLREAKIVVPHDDLLAAADNFIAPLIEKATSTQTNSGTLEATRDVLLPRLLSGELQVV